MSTNKVKTLFLCVVTGVGFLFLRGCGSGDPAGEVTTEEAAQLFKSTKEALLQTGTTSFCTIEFLCDHFSIPRENVSGVTIGPKSAKVCNHPSMPAQLADSKVGI